MNRILCLLINVLIFVSQNSFGQAPGTNLIRYRYFPKFAMLPDTIRPELSTNYIRLTWENHGVAPAFHKYKLYLKLINRSNCSTFIQQLTESNNLTWQPDEIVAEQCAVHPGNDLIKGRRDILIGMMDDCEFLKTDSLN
jgi:hypothetical protein